MCTLAIYKLQYYLFKTKTISMVNQKFKKTTSLDWPLAQLLLNTKTTVQKKYHTVALIYYYYYY